MPTKPAKQEELYIRPSVAFEPRRVLLSQIALSGPNLFFIVPQQLLRTSVEYMYAIRTLSRRMSVNGLTAVSMAKQTVQSMVQRSAGEQSVLVQTMPRSESPLRHGDAGL